MTRFKTVDNRKNPSPVFANISLGDMFTDESGHIFIKIETVYTDDKEDCFNVVGLYGDLSCFDDDEEVFPIKNITFTIEE